MGGGVENRLERKMANSDEPGRRLGRTTDPVAEGSQVCTENAFSCRKETVESTPFGLGLPIPAFRLESVQPALRFGERTRGGFDRFMTFRGGDT